MLCSQILLALPMCHLRYHIELWNNRSTGLLRFLILRGGILALRAHYAHTARYF